MTSWCLSGTCVTSAAVKASHGSRPLRCWIVLSLTVRSLSVSLRHQEVPLVGFGPDTFSMERPRCVRLQVDCGRRGQSVESAIQGCLILQQLWSIRQRRCDSGHEWSRQTGGSYVRLIYAARAPDGDLWSEHDHVHYDCHLMTISLYFNWGSL